MIKIVNNISNDANDDKVTNQIITAFMSIWSQLAATGHVVPLEASDVHGRFDGADQRIAFMLHICLQNAAEQFIDGGASLVEDAARYRVAVFVEQIVQLVEEYFIAVDTVGETAE